jgi:phosphohistidine phosphatase SixA
MNHSRSIVVLIVSGVALFSGASIDRVTPRAVAEKSVTVFFVRHAETGPRPKRRLSALGEKRAGALQRLLGATGITHLFSSDFARTRGTLAPLARTTGLKVTLISPARPAPQAAAIRALPAGAIAVVAGHSNTLPPLIKTFGHAITGLTRRGFIVDEVHDRLFVMTLAGGESSVVELRFGAAVARAPVVKIADDDVQVGVANNERESRSVFFYSRTAASVDVHGQFELTYGAPTWQAAHLEALKKSKVGDRLRLGNNFFATFDTSCPVDLGGSRLSPGVYYLALERGTGDNMSLVFLDPGGIRAKKLNSSQTSETEGGLAAAMTWSEVETSAEKLEITLKSQAKRGSEATLTIRFGKQQLTGTLTAILGD